MRVTNQKKSSFFERFCLSFSTKLTRGDSWKQRWVHSRIESSTTTPTMPSFRVQSTAAQQSIRQRTLCHREAVLLGQTRKHRSHLRLLQQMMEDELPFQIAGSKTMLDAFTLLRSYPMIGDFLAYQYVTDLNYRHPHRFLGDAIRCTRTRGQGGNLKVFSTAWWLLQKPILSGSSLTDKRPNLSGWE